MSEVNIQNFAENLKDLNLSPIPITGTDKNGKPKACIIQNWQNIHFTGQRFAEGDILGLGIKLGLNGWNGEGEKAVMCYDLDIKNVPEHLQEEIKTNFIDCMPPEGENYIESSYSGGLHSIFIVNLEDNPNFIKEARRKDKILKPVIEILGTQSAKYLVMNTWEQNGSIEYNIPEISAQGFMDIAEDLHKMLDLEGLISENKQNGSQEDPDPKYDNLKAFTSLTAQEKAKVERYLEEIEKQGKDIAPDHAQWLSMSFAFASLGEAGREYFHRACQYWKKPGEDKEYERKLWDKEFNGFLETHDPDRSPKLDKFFKLCHKQGIKDPGIQDEKEFYFFDDIINYIEPPKLWEFIPITKVSAIVGGSDVGKTTLLFDLCIHIMKGESSFLGWDLNPRHRRVMIVSSEEGLGDFKRRFEQCQYTPKNDQIILRQEMGDFNSMIDRIDATLTDYPCDLVIFDPWGSINPGEEAKNTRPKLEAMRGLVMKHESSIMIVHHTTKASESIPHKHSTKGSSDFEQFVRCEIMLSEYDDNVYLTCVKGNFIPKRIKEISYCLEFNHEKQTVTRDGRNRVVYELRDAMSRDIIGKKAKHIPWEEILNEPMIHKKLTEKIARECDMSIANAKVRISNAVSDGLIIKDEGVYKLHDNA